MRIKGELNYEEIKEGMYAEFSRKITEEDMESFKMLSGDTSELHTSEQYANTTAFGHRIVYGLLIASLFSKIFGTYFLGRRNVCLSQSFKYKNYASIGDTVSIKATVVRKVDSLRLIELELVASCRLKELVTGQATIKEI